MHDEHGLTLIELAVVLALIGLLAAFAVPNISRYQTVEEAKGAVTTVAAALRQARSLAMKEGVQYLVILNPGGTPAGTVARVIRDADANLQQSAGDLVRDVTVRQKPSSQVSAYNAPSSPPGIYPNATLPPEDPASGGGALLGSVANGANFPIDPITNSPAVCFTTRGIPVPLGNPGNLGAGAGAYYITDNQSSVFAATVGALGEVRVRTLAPHSGNWR